MSPLSNANTVKPKVTIVIPTYNRKRDVIECLESLQNLNYPNYEVIVVDNGSTDGTAEAIRRHYPNFRLIRIGKNLGVTGGRNLGAKQASGKYILFLDHDTIIDKHALSELITVMLSDSEIGADGPVIYYYDDPKRIWACGTSISLTTGRISFNAAGQFDNGKLDKVMEVQVLPTAILVRREITDRVGLFDDIFFAVYEDTDFCFRIRKAGFKVVCVSTAKVWHKVPLGLHQQVIGVFRRSYYIARNRIVFMKKHVKVPNFLLFLTMFMPIYALYYTIKSVKMRRLDFALNYWRGVIAGIWSLTRED